MLDINYKKLVILNTKKDILTSIVSKTRAALS